MRPCAAPHAAPTRRAGLAHGSARNPSRSRVRVSPVLDGVRYHESVLETVGGTPLVRLRALARHCPPPVLAKLEFFNPGGSVKDRIGLAMVEAAEREGRLKPGGTIVECTSGNTGVGLAMVAAIRGYHAVFCMPDKVSSEKVNLLKAFGAEVQLSPTAVPPDSPESYYSVARRIARERPGAYLTDQYSNPANPEAHYGTTGPEIWEQTGGRITHYVAGMGTGGTISGAGRYLKERKPGLEVVGEDFIPAATDFGVIDRVVACTDRDGLNLTRRLAREEAIFVGGSSGMAAWVALEIAKHLPPTDLVVVLLPDTGERYLTKVHNDAWMRDNHLLDPRNTRVSELVSSKANRLPPLLKVEAGELVRRALTLVEQHEVTQLPVFRNGEVVGTVYDNEILKVVLGDIAALDRPVESLMGDPLPVVRSDQSVDDVTRLLAARNPAVLVREDGAVVGILTRFDMLQ